MSLQRESWALFWSLKIDGLHRGWYKFSRNSLSVIGLSIVLVVILSAALAPFIAPFPEHAGTYVNIAEAHQPPSLKHLFGTDRVGRDVFSRVIFGSRFSLMLGVVVLSLSVPVGIIMGLTAGYYSDSWVENVIMRITDIFLAVPPLILALTVSAVLEPSLVNSMMAVSVTWWPWFCRLVYAATLSIRNESFVRAAEITGATRLHILIKEILPNCRSTIFTKMTLDVGIVILVGAALSFVGLGVQPPKPGLGTMVAEGARQNISAYWWDSLFPALAIVVIVLGFNLLGDGLRDLFDVEEI